MLVAQCTYRILQYLFNKPLAKKRGGGHKLLQFTGLYYLKKCTSRQSLGLYTIFDKISFSI